MYPDPDSKSARLFDEARAFMPGGSTRHSVLMNPYPIYGESGHGCRLTDVDGNEYVDCVNNMSTLIHGHGDERTRAALHGQIDRLISVGCPTSLELDLARLICERVKTIDQVRFTNSGSEAVGFAVRAARAFTGREKIAKIEGGYHGSQEIMEISVRPHPGKMGDPTAPTSVPDTGGIARSVVDDVIVIPYNDVQQAREVLLRHKDELAAVFLDPLVAWLAFTPASDDYIRMLRDVTAEHGMVFISDEVFSFRLSHGGAQARHDYEPDITTLGKVIGGGLPVGAFGGRKEIMDVFDASAGRPVVDHQGTFNANPLTMTAGLSCMEQLTAAAFDHLEAIGDQLRDGLQKAMADAGVQGTVKGDASLVSIILAPGDFHNYRTFRDVMKSGGVERGAVFHRHLLNHGVWHVGPTAFILSTAMTSDDIDFILEQATGALDAVKQL